MSESTRVIIILILILILLMGIAYFGTGFLVRRATRNVIKAFRQYEALSPEKALLLEDMRLRNSSIFQVKGLRDYRPAAIQFLMKGNIIRVTDDGKLYLSEETLAQSGIEKNVQRRF